jgi:hypothetical protein
MSKTIIAIAAAAALIFSGGVLAQAPVVGNISQAVTPSLGRQALPIGAAIQGGTDMGTTIVGAKVTLPGGPVLVDVIVTQIARDVSGRVVGGTVSDKLNLLPPSASSVAIGAGMTGALSPTLLGALAIGAAVVIGAGGNSTPSHAAQ